MRDTYPQSQTSLDMNNIEVKSWEEFRATGLLLIVNTILHCFGWVIVCTMDKGKVIDVNPARTKYRGFSYEDQAEAHTKLAEYLSNNASGFPAEIQ